MYVSMTKWKLKMTLNVKKLSWPNVKMTSRRNGMKGGMKEEMKAKKKRQTIYEKQKAIIIRNGEKGILMIARHQS